MAKDTVKGAETGLEAIYKHIENLLSNPTKELNEDMSKLMLMCMGLTNPVFSKAAFGDIGKNVEDIIERNFQNEVINGDEYSRDKYISSAALWAATAGIPVANALKGLSGLEKADEIGEVGLNSEKVEYYLSKSRNNIDSDTVILGSTGKYDIIAENEGYTYFKMSDDIWTSLEKESGSDYDEIWKVNKQFIDEQIVSNKNILLSNDPYKGYYFDDGEKRFYQREIDYITQKGYTFEVTSDGLWKAIRK